MIRKFTLLFFCFFFYFSHIGGQVPGYLGKRFFVKADLFATPTVLRPTAANKGLGNLFGDNPSISLAFNTQIGGQIGYAISRTEALTLACNYLKTGLVVQKAYTKSPAPPSNTGGINYDVHELFYNVSGLTYDLGYQVYRQGKGAIAPLGNYISYHFGASVLNGEVLDKRTRYYDSYEKNHGKLGINPRTNYFSVGIEFGKNTILFDRLLLNSAFRFNLPLSIFQFGKYSDLAIGNYSSRYEEYNQKLYDKELTTRMAYHSMFMMHLSIGILP